MTTETAMRISGFFFLFIIITNLIADRFGYKTIGELDAEARLQKTVESPGRFKISTVIILIEHAGIIALAFMLFVAFNSFNLALALVWLVFRALEGLIQIYYKKDYWRLLDLAGRYTNSSGEAKTAAIESTQSILRTKDSVFSFTQILFSIGTLAYSIFFVLYGFVPLIIAWSGIVAATIYGLGNIIFRIKSSSKTLWNIGGLLILLLELVLGGWLLFYPHNII